MWISLGHSAHLEVDLIECLLPWCVFLSTNIGVALIPNSYPRKAVVKLGGLFLKVTCWRRLWSQCKHLVFAAEDVVLILLSRWEKSGNQVTCLACWLVTREVGQSSDLPLLLTLNEVWVRSYSLMTYPTYWLSVRCKWGRAVRDHSCLCTRLEGGRAVWWLVPPFDSQRGLCKVGQFENFFACGFITRGVRQSTDLFRLITLGKM